MPPSDPNLGKTGASPGWGRLERGPFRRVNPKSLELLRFHSAQKWRTPFLAPAAGNGRILRLGPKEGARAGRSASRQARRGHRPGRMSCRHAQAPSGGSHPGMHFDLMAGLRNARIQRCHGVGRRTRPASWRTVLSNDRGGGEPWARAGTWPAGDVWPAGFLRVGAAGGSGGVDRRAREGRSVRSDRDPPFFRAASA